MCACVRVCVRVCVCVCGGGGGWYIDRCVCVRARVMMRDRKKSAEREISEIDLSNLALEREYVLSTSRAREYVFGIYLKLLSDNRVLRICIRIRYTVIYIYAPIIFFFSLSRTAATPPAPSGGGGRGVCSDQPIRFHL